jgi:NAD(P)-dependent dehydrogenase (short-subunit alcohol dehydrogenase family)
VTTNILENQVAIVTGAGRGIGKAAAFALARAGAAVVLAARSEGEINGVANEIKQAGGRALAIPTDISELAQVDHMLVLTLRAFGKVDILVNNAAVVAPLGNVWELSPRAWQRSIDVNLVGPFLGARVVLPHMLERGSGRIINVSSGVADAHLAGTSAYGAGKAALESFSGILAAEVAGSGVVVTAFRPGIVDTAMQAELRETPTRQSPLAARSREWRQDGQLQSPAEPALAILWLASAFADNANGILFNLNDEDFRRRVMADLGVGANQYQLSN